MDLEKPGTWQHEVSACKGGDFLGNQQLPPEHVDVVEKFLFAIRKERAAELHALSTLWLHRNRHAGPCCPGVLSSSKMASYHFCHMAFVLLMPLSRRFFWLAVIDQLVPSSPLQFLDPCHLLHCLSHPERGFGYFVLGCLDLHMVLPATSWLRRPRPAAPYVPHRPAGMMLLLVGHQFPLDRLAGSSDLALVVDDGPAQLTRISLSCAICPALDQEVPTFRRWYPVVDSLGLLLQQQRLEILSYWRVRSGGSCTRWIVVTSPEPRVS